MPEALRYLASAAAFKDTPQDHQVRYVFTLPSYRLPSTILLPVSHAGSRLDWNTAVSLVFFVWLSSAFWAALPLLGWGHYDYEPLGTCCTLDYSRGDR